MLAFGLGTLPMLFLIGSTASRFNHFIRNPLTRQLAGSLILLFGFYNIFLPSTHQHHDHTEIPTENILYGGSHHQYG